MPRAPPIRHLASAVCALRANIERLPFAQAPGEAEQGRCVGDRTLLGSHGLRFERMVLTRQSRPERLPRGSKKKEVR